MMPNKGSVGPEFVEQWFGACGHLPIAAIVTDATGVVTHWSDHASQLYQYAAAEALGTDIRDLTVGPAEAETAEEILGQIAQGRGWEGEFEATRRDGTKVAVHVLDLPVVDGRGELVGIVGLSLDVSGPRRTLQEATDRAREVALVDSRAREDERRRIARELHDELGQVLTTLRTDLFWLEERVPDDSPEAVRVNDMAVLVGLLLNSVRRICADLRPAVLDDAGLGAAIAWQASRFAERTGITVAVDVPDDFTMSDAGAGVDVFRVVQESLTNIERHAYASHVTIASSCDASSFVLVIEDDGKGLDEQATPGFGRRSMAERIERLGGTIEISPRKGGGTRVCARIPLDLVDRPA